MGGGGGGRRRGGGGGGGLPEGPSEEEMDRGEEGTNVRIMNLLEGGRGKKGRDHKFSLFLSLPPSPSSHQIGTLHPTFSFSLSSPSSYPPIPGMPQPDPPIPAKALVLHLPLPLRPKPDNPKHRGREREREREREVIGLSHWRSLGRDRGRALK